ncbi:unnamed protein product [Paramecium sonneborni]|uniref:Uncharacterized protein n=1 Tax=Paramecium sonneborni TaxID=65129 RepID=A0A8S1PT23_9CILI|nr:unnamed protein product [Paramecium sonneborni]
MKVFYKLDPKPQVWLLEKCQSTLDNLKSQRCLNSLYFSNS